MRAMERLRDLDRAAERVGQRFRVEYDAPPPWWLRYGGIGFIFLGPAALPLTLATSPVATLALLAALLGVYALAVTIWVARHRQ